MKCYRVTAFGAPLEPHERATPQPEGNEVLVRVAAAGMCHSDLHIWEGGYDLGGGRRLLVKDRGVALPLVMGHETAGQVAAVGERVTDVRVGGMYLVYPWIGCGSCLVCMGGDEHLCASPRSLGVFRDGGYADHVLVPHARYLLDLDGLHPVVAAPLACSGLTAFSALNKASFAIERGPIVIVGAGGLGLMGVAILKALGGVGAVVVDIDERKRAAALDAGALAVVDGRASDAVGEILRAAGGPPQVAIDFVGSSETAALGFACLPKGGTLICVGLFGGAAPWSLPLIPMRAITIRGSYVGSLAELKALLSLVRRSGTPLIPITTTPLENVNGMLTALQQGNVVGRAVLTPQAE